MMVVRRTNPYDFNFNPYRPRAQPRYRDYNPYLAMRDVTGMVVMGGVTLGAIGMVGSVVPLFIPKT